MTRFGWLAALLLPLLLLAGAGDAHAHEEPGEAHKCVACHVGHQSALLAAPPAVTSVREAIRVVALAETPRTPLRRVVRRPARAPPA